MQAFLQRAKQVQRFTAGRARLIFAIDATASRQPTWDLACSFQADMFAACSDLNSLSMQLAYFRGLNELRATDWVHDGQALAQTMSRVRCEAGRTQIGRLLKSALKTHAQGAVSALVFIGDAVEESAPRLQEIAGECRIKRLPLFLFQEGNDPHARSCMQKMAQLSGGAYESFDQRSAQRLKDLLSAVARYAAGGRPALESMRSQGAQVLLQQLKP
ncbi:MAG: hypothetical protein Cons2KO_24140 [Congregibacter sp.]